MALYTWRYEAINPCEEWRRPKNRGHKVAVDAALSHLTERILSAFSFAFHTNFGMCVCVCLHIRVYTGALMCMHEARGGIWGPCFTTPYCLEMGSLAEPGRS